MSESPVRPGAEPFSATGGPVGVLVCHGFTDNPGTMRPLAEALAEAGFTVECPRLPGHGTSVDDMVDTRFSDYTATVDATYAELSTRCERVVVVGLSMGATLTCWLAARRADVAGIVCINPLVMPQHEQAKEMVKMMLDAGETVAPGIGSDIADPEGHEDAYDGSPLAPALSLFEGLDELQARLADIACPVLIMTSPQDHVVPPENSDHLVGAVGGPVERATLDRSYHVATLDFDKDEVIARTVEFVRKVTTP